MEIVGPGMPDRGICRSRYQLSCGLLCACSRKHSVMGRDRMNVLIFMMEQVQIVFDEEKKTLKLIYVRRDA